MNPFRQEIAEQTVGGVGYITGGSTIDWHTPLVQDCPEGQGYTSQVHRPSLTPITPGLWHAKQA